ncbi:MULTISPECIES: hypothetical protein [unclassified Candidatus Tisiphia]|uniref:hypothetical protein n=1 Tax=unclassified Candidatus Tisiphia TaxID=2996318 RepID=UPI00312C9061
MSNIAETAMRFEKFLSNIREGSNIKELLTKHNDNLLEFIERPDSIEKISELSLVKSVIDGKHTEHIQKINRILESKDKSFRVRSNGQIIGFGKYEVLDIGWAESLITFLENMSDPVPFRESTTIIPMSEKARISIFGDFGTGDWDGSMVASTISKNIKNLEPCYSIHLGDVYYTGDAIESRNKLLSLWPTATKGNFTLNSNHEMFDGARGYFNTTLADKIFAQQQSSYFALENNYWVIVGLDSAYFSDVKDLYMDGRLNDSQISFLKQIALKNKKTIVLTHHCVFDYVNNNKMPIWDQVKGALGNNLKYWYYGNLHCAAVYQDIDNVKVRLSGHAAIPYGNASAFAGNSEVIWHENTPAQNDDIRVQNGFCLLTLDNENIIEEFYGEDGKVHYSSIE